MPNRKLHSLIGVIQGGGLFLDGGLHILECLKMHFLGVGEARGSFALTFLFMIDILSVQYRATDGRSTVRQRGRRCLYHHPLHYRAIRLHYTSQTRIGRWIIVTCQNQVSATFELMPPPLRNDYCGCITVYCFSLCRGDRITNAGLPLAVTSGRPTNEKPGPAFCRLLCQTGLFVCVKIPGELVNGGRTVGEAYSRISNVN